MILFCPSVGKICPEQAENAVLPVIYYICNYARSCQNRNAQIDSVKASRGRVRRKEVAAFTRLKMSVS